MSDYGRDETVQYVIRTSQGQRMVGVRWLDERIAEWERDVEARRREREAKGDNQK